jgi:hypothetical protein
MEYADWVAAGRRMGAVGRASQWWIGDWVRFGTSTWGKKYTEAAKITGYDQQSLRNLAWVASRFDLSRRRDNLSWTHHAEVAALAPDQQDEWLDRATELSLSAADLRVELRGARRGAQADPEAVEEADQTPGGLVCPNCGVALTATA